MYVYCPIDEPNEMLAMPGPSEFVDGVSTRYRDTHDNIRFIETYEAGNDHQPVRSRWTVEGTTKETRDTVTIGYAMRVSYTGS